jgi:hypothetical protein
MDIAPFLPEIFSLRSKQSLYSHHNHDRNSILGNHLS